VKNFIIRTITIIIYLAVIPQLAMAAADPTLFGGFGKNVGDSFTGTNLLLHGAAFASTALIINRGYDARVRDTFRHSKNEAAFPGAVLGSGLGALGAATWLYYSRDSANDRENMGGIFAIAQASLITVSYIILLKFTTGRAHPTNNWPLSSQEQSEQFQFGFLRNGLTAYGWPSGHVSHTVAVTSALAHYYPDKTWLKWFGIGLSSYMLYTVSAYDSGQMHWFSDGVAGAFMGYAIGSTVGKNFRSEINGSPEVASTISLIPMITSNHYGAIATFAF